MYPAVALDVCKFIVENYNGDLDESVRYLMQEYDTGASPRREGCPNPEANLHGRPEMVMVRQDCMSDQVSGHSSGQPSLEIAEGDREPLIRSVISEEGRRERPALSEEHAAEAANSEDDRGPPRRPKTEEELLSELSYLNALEQEIERKKTSLAEEERALNSLAARVASLGSELAAESEGSPPQEGAPLGRKPDEERVTAVANAVPLQMSSYSDGYVGPIEVRDLPSNVSGAEVALGTGAEPAAVNSHPPDCTSLSGSGFALATEGGNAVASLPDPTRGFCHVEFPDSSQPAAPGDEFSERQEIAAASSELSWSDLGNDVQEAK